jgi:hypothetical protein
LESLQAHERDDKKDDDANKPRCEPRVRAEKNLDDHLVRVSAARHHDIVARAVETDTITTSKSRKAR